MDVQFFYAFFLAYLKSELLNTIFIKKVAQVLKNVVKSSYC